MSGNGSVQTTTSIAYLFFDPHRSFQSDLRTHHVLCIVCYFISLVINRIGAILTNEMKGIV